MQNLPRKSPLKNRKNLWIWLLLLGVPMLGECCLMVSYAPHSYTFRQRHSEFYGWISTLLLLLVLLARPLKLVGQRRVLGLFAFGFALLHSWLAFDAVMGLDWQKMVFLSLENQRAIWAGLISLLGFVPLAITSTPFAMARMGRHWKTLHRLNPLLTVLAVLHTVWIGVHFGITPLKWTSVVLVLLTLLILGFRGWKGKQR